MKTYEQRIEELVERAIEKRHMPLHDLIESENLQEYTPGTLTILSGDELNNAIVPCRGFMILVRDRYDETAHDFIAEYAIYSEHDNDDLKPLYNAMNANATYKLEMVGEETFENMAYAICYATRLIETMTKYDDPIDMLMNMSNPGEQWTVEDAGQCLSEAEAAGWRFAPNVDAQFILDLYNDMEPEEEE